MRRPPPDTAAFLANVRVEGSRIASLTPTSLHATVPSLPDWNVERVIRHVGRVHRWVTGLLEAPADADPNAVAKAAPALSKGPACLVDYQRALDEMLAMFADRAPDQPVASFIGSADVAFWARRQAHEVTVHRVDAFDAVHSQGGSDVVAIDQVIAADGIAEWLEVFVARRVVGGGSTPDSPLCGRTIRIATVDGDDPDAPQWLLRFDDSCGVVIDNSDASRRTDPEVTLRGSAGTLLLTLWRRRELERIDIVGDRRIAEALYDTMRF